MNDHKLSGVAIAVGAVVGGLGVMVPVAFFSGLSLGRSLRQPPAPPPAACVCQAPQPEKVKLSLRTYPSGADVYFADGSHATGKTPLELEVPRGDPPFDVRAVLAGYRSEVLEMMPTLNREYVLTLTPDGKHHHEDCDGIDILAPHF